MATWRNDFSSLYILFLIILNNTHHACKPYVCNTCFVLRLHSDPSSCIPCFVFLSVLPPRRHGLLSKTRNEDFSHLPFLLTQVLVRNCSTRYEFLKNGSRWESRTAVPGISAAQCPSLVHACMHFVRVHCDSPISALLKRRSHPVGRTTGLTGFPLFSLLQRTLWTSDDIKSRLSLIC